MINNEQMIEACAGGLTLFGVPRQIGRKVVRQNMERSAMTCDEKLKRALATPWEFAGEPLVLCQLLRAECLKDKAELAEFLEMNAGMKEGFSIRLGDIQNEISSVLQMLDELAELWGDEGKFRACRDRLRKLVTE